MITVHIPFLPCGRVPSQCPNNEPHAAHDFKPDWVQHEGWHCYGSSITPTGKHVGWAGGTDTPGDAMDACQNAKETL
jgi:hypothetical protein